MILNKPGEPDLTQVRVEIAKRLRKEIGSAVLKSSETAEDKEAL